MGEFLVEFYISRSDIDSARGTAQRARLAAEELTVVGSPVRFVRSIFLTEDETCFFLYEADSPTAVRAAAQRAGLPIERVRGVITDGPDERFPEQTTPGIGTRPSTGPLHAMPEHRTTLDDTTGDSR